MHFISAVKVTNDKDRQEHFDFRPAVSPLTIVSDGSVGPVEIISCREFNSNPLFSCDRLSKTLCETVKSSLFFHSFFQLCFWGLIWFLKALRLPKHPFHLTLVIWNIFSFKPGLWLKTKGCLSQRAGFLPLAFENSLQQIMVNKCTKASPCVYAGQLSSKCWPTIWQTTKCCHAYGHDK